MDGGVTSAVFARYRDVEPIHRDHPRFSSVKPKVAGLERLDYFNGQPNLAYVDPPDTPGCGGSSSRPSARGSSKVCSPASRPRSTSCSLARKRAVRASNS